MNILSRNTSILNNKAISFIIKGAIGAAVVGLAAFSTPTKVLAAGESQVSFHAGYSYYVHQLYVTGVNQRGNTVTWGSPWYQEPYRTLATNNWWWKPERGVKLSFFLTGYGWKNCTVTTSPSPRVWMHVTYLGGGKCSTYFSDSQW